MKILIPYFFLLLLIGCSSENVNFKYYGFWEGPHPEDSSKKFYVHIENCNDSLTAKGYWTQNSFYQARFKVDSIIIIGEYIRFFIPNWNCTYSSRLAENNILNGGFECEGDPFDSVQLVKNDRIENYLIHSKPDCKKGDFQYKYVRPDDLNDKIETSGFQSTNDSLFISSLVPEIIEGDYGRLNSFLLFKNNNLICEEYFYGYSKNDLHQIESCTKSLTSLLVGIAKDKNLITDINEPIYKIFPEYEHLRNEGYNEITISNLLTMTSGFDPQNDQLFQSDKRIDFALKRKIINKPGSTFKYDGGNTEILGAILKAKTGMFADAFAEKYLFDPLSIQTFNWDIFRQEGFPSVADSLHLLPRDMLKIGVLVLNNGKFNTQQVVSEKWIQESTQVKTKTHIPGDDYSYQWWNLRLQSNGKVYKSIWANGWGSQFIYIFPEIDVVIVTTGQNYEGDSWAITQGISRYLYLLDK